MNRGAAGRPIFHGDVDRIELERLLGTVHERFGVQVHASCFMGNHFHLLLRCPDGGLSPSMQVVASSFTRFVNDRAGTDGPIFRGRFRSLPIVDEHQLLHVMRYIHRNPLEFVPSAALAAYRWSSFGAYLERRVPPPWLVTDELLGRFSEGRNGLARFVLEPLHDVPPEHIRRIAVTGGR